MRTISWKEKQFNILKSLNDICRDNGMQIFLYGETALQAYRDGTLSDYVTVCMDAGSIEKLIALMQKGSTSLRLEGMFTNPQYPVFNMRIYDSGTVDFDVNNFQYYSNCLNVRIEIIKHVPGSKLSSRYFNMLNSGFKDVRSSYYENSKAAGGNFLKRKMRDSLSSGIKASGIDAVAADTFHKLVKGYSGGSRNLKIGTTGFDGDTFDKTRTVELMGESFGLPYDTEKFLAAQFGREWRDYREKTFTESVTKFRDADHGWQEYMNLTTNIDFADFRSAIDRSKSIKKAFSEYNDIIQYKYRILDRTDARIKLYEKYAPMKEKILGLLREEDYDALKEILAEYLEALSAFEKDRLGLCFDPEIFDAARAVLVHEGRADYAERLDGLIPDEHRKELRIRDYRGEYPDR